MKDESMGALWIKDGPKCKFMSGVIEIGDDKYNVVVFKNTYKEPGDNKPDYRILKARPKGQGEEGKKEFKDSVPF